MGDILNFALDGHGGLDRWNRFRSVFAHLSQGGALWAMKQQPGVLDDVGVLAELRTERVSHGPFGPDGIHTEFSPDRVAIVSASGSVLDELTEPRASFAGHGQDTPWTLPQLAYFAGAAMWTYLTQPFSLTMPGFVITEGEPWTEDGRTFRRMDVTWPTDLATHNRNQSLYLDEDGLIYRHDYSVEISGNTPAAHYMSEYQTVSGLKVPMRHRVYPRGDDGAPIRDLLVVSIDYRDVRFIER
ncbi:hypothetical protein ACWDRB_30195 [Nonomuraea sp. NPDC003707]